MTVNDFSRNSRDYKIEESGFGSNARAQTQAMPIVPLALNKDIEVFENETLVYKNPHVTAKARNFTKFNGESGDYLTVTTGAGGGGAVIVPVMNFRGINFFCLVSEYRLPVDEEALGFPRGGQDLGETIQETAQRELLEETGIETCDLVYLGKVQPDNGILTNEVDAFFAQTAEISNPHIDNETGGQTRWVAHGELRGLIKSGKIKCGISLSALMLTEISGRLR